MKFDYNLQDTETLVASFLLNMQILVHNFEGQGWLGKINTLICEKGSFYKFEQGPWNGHRFRQSRACWPNISTQKHIVPVETLKLKANWIWFFLLQSNWCKIVHIQYILWYKFEYNSIISQITRLRRFFLTN